MNITYNLSMLCLSFLILLLFSFSVMSDSLRPHGQQHAGLPCPSLSPGVCSSSCSLKSMLSSNHLVFCHHLLFLPSIFPSIRVFSYELALPIKWPSIGASASVSVPLMNIKDWFFLGWTGLISLQFKGLSRVFSSTTVRRHQVFGAEPSLWSNSHIHTWLL